MTSIQINTPVSFGTRAVPDVFGDTQLVWNAESGYPSIGNVDLRQHPISYTVGVYVGKVVNGNTVYSLVDKQSKTGVASDEAYFNFSLIKGQTYRLVAYADFSSTDKEDLENIDFKTDLNDELDDAFFVSKDFTAQDHVAAILKRPFGKLRLIANDFNTFAAGEKYTITDVKVSYKGQPMLATDKFNALTSDFNYEATAEGDVECSNKPASYAMEFDANGSAEYAAVFTHYLPANFGEEDRSGLYRPVDETLPVPQSWMYPFDVTVTYEDETGAVSTITRSYDLDIPVKRNWLTTVEVKNFWTENSLVKVSVDHRFDGFINEKQPVIEYVYDEDQLEEAFNKIVTSDSHVGKIILGNDILINRHQYYMVWGKGNPMKVTLDLNGYRIEQHTPDNFTSEDYTEAIFEIASPYSSETTLIIEDSSKEATGAILATDRENAPDCIPIWAQFGGRVIINGGTIKCCRNNPAVYTYDTVKMNNDLEVDSPSVVTINGGWFENIDGNIPVEGDSYMKKNSDVLLNIYNDDNMGIFHVNGGSFVGFDPSTGDSKSGNSTNQWVDDDHYVINETIDGTTVFTVLAKDNPSYY